MSQNSPQKRRASRFAVFTIAFSFVASLMAAAPATAETVTAAPAAAPAAEPAASYSKPLRTAVNDLAVRPEDNDGYNRSRDFGDWTDADRDCQNTRAEVLIDESAVPVTFTNPNNCVVATGSWTSPYGGGTFTSASQVQIDHMVPAKEAWGSGAKQWDRQRRGAFYNDLGDARSLNAIPGSMNSSKGDKGPEEWMPPAGQCQYIGDWVAVKIRWNLSVDNAEKSALTRWANDCPNRTITVNRV